MIDSHCHLDFKEFEKDLNKVLNNAEEQNVIGMQTICTKITEFYKVLNLATKYKNIWCSVGTHPHNAEEEKNITKQFDDKEKDE